jgi:RimJ/RimL family protein N-acetyltransferase
MTDAPTLLGPRLTLVPVAADHVAELRRILHTPEVYARWGDDDADPAWPLEAPDIVRFAILAERRVAGLVQYSEEPESMYRHAGIDIYLEARWHGRGLGREAVAVLAAYLVDVRGHHRLVIDPAADNAPAIRCYSAVGFRPVGVLRAYERDPLTGRWRDGLLMDLLAAELVREPAGRNTPPPAGT